MFTRIRAYVSLVIWNFCMRFRLPLPFAPVIFGWVIGVRPARVDALFRVKHPRHQRNLVTLLDGLKKEFGGFTKHTGFSTDHYACRPGELDPHVLSIGGLQIYRREDVSVSVFGAGVFFGIGSLAVRTWPAYVQDTFGVAAGNCSEVWRYLDSPMWPDNPQEAIARLERYIAGFNPVTDKWDFNTRYTTKVDQE